MKKQNKNRTVEEFKSSAFEEKVLYINRCSKVVKAGRKFSFSALIVVGDGQGHIGFGFAKANEVSNAISKGTEAAKKNIMTFEMDGTTIPHEISVNSDGCIIMLKPAPTGTGVIAGSKVRSILELGGIKDVVGKLFGSNNPFNQARATMKALSSLKNRKKIFMNRSNKVISSDLGEAI